MLIVMVSVRVLPDQVSAFERATRENASQSSKEPGIARFDVLRDQVDPTRFLLVEVYRNAEAPAAHKQTAHYLEWRSTVESMMAEPRQSVKYDNVFPEDDGW